MNGNITSYTFFYFFPDLTDLSSFIGEKVGHASKQSLGVERGEQLSGNYIWPRLLWGFLEPLRHLSLCLCSLCYYNILRYLLKWNILRRRPQDLSGNIISKLVNDFLIFLLSYLRIGRKLHNTALQSNIPSVRHMNVISIPASLGIEG